MNSLKEAVQYLLDNGYMTIIKGRYCVTQKFNKEVRNVEEGVVHIQGIPLVRDVVHDAKTLTKIHWRNRYIQFIKDAGVPAKAEGSNGDLYDCNKFSEDGLKAYRAALEKELLDERVLLAVTKLYYAGTSRFKQKIGSYMVDGTWRTGYQDMLERAEQGMESVKEHIQNQLSSNASTTYTSRRRG